MAAIRHLLLACSLVALGSVAAAAQASAGSLELRVLQGDPAPSTGGGTFGSTMFRPSINANREVAFQIDVVGGSVTHGIFSVDSLGTHSARALPGQVAPDTGGGDYTDLMGPPAINGAADVAFAAQTSSIFSEGIFVVDAAGTHTARAVWGDSAPTSGGIYNGFRPPSINDSGDVAFACMVFGGTSPEGIFVIDSSDTHVAKALDGMTAPGTGGTFSSFGSPAINASGDVAFHAFISGGSASNGIFIVDASGVTTARALKGQTAPGTDGGIYTLSSQPAINDAGDVVFYSGVAGGSTSFGIFTVDAAGTHTARALIGDVAPATGGGTYNGFDLSPVIYDLGTVALRSAISGGSTSQGTFEVDSSGEASARFLAGDAVPGMTGVTFAALAGPVANSAGDFAFWALLTGASGPAGLFVSGPPKHVPGMGLGALGVLVVIQSLIGVRALARRRNR